MRRRILAIGGGAYGYAVITANQYRHHDASVLQEASTWSLDNWGEYLVACHYDDGRLLEWQLNTSLNAAPITNAPIDNLGLVVTEERFIFALGAGGNPAARCNGVIVKITRHGHHHPQMKLVTLNLQTSGQIMQGIRTRGQTLIITDTDAHTARYLGPPYVYGFERVGTSCGAISRKAASDVDVGVFWMGQRGFFRFDGNSVSEVTVRCSRLCVWRLQCSAAV